MSINDIIKYIKANSEKGLLEVTRLLVRQKLQMNVILLIDNHDRSKILGHKIFKSYDLLEQYIANLPMKYGFVYFNIENGKSFSGASFFDQGWMCEYDGQHVTITDYYDEDIGLLSGTELNQTYLFDINSKIKVVS